MRALLALLLLLVAFAALASAQDFSVLPFSLIGGVLKNERGLCCNGSASTGAAWGVPQVPDCGSSEARLATATPSVQPDPINNPYVQGIAQFFPYCTPLLEYYSRNGSGVMFPVTPTPGDPLWTGFQGSTTATLSIAYELVRRLGHGPSVLPWMSKDCLSAVIRNVCYTIFREAYVVAPPAFPVTLAVPRPTPPEVITAFDTITNPYETLWDWVDKKPEKDPQKIPTCRMVMIAFAQGIMRRGLASINLVAQILPFPDDCECGCRSGSSNPLVAGQKRFVGNQNYTVAPGLTLTAPAKPALPLSAFDQTGKWECYLPWVKAPEDFPLGYCGIRCPSPFRTNWQYKQAAILMGIVGWASYIVTIFVFATMICMPRYRHFPANLVLFVLFCSHVLAFAFVFSITRGWRRTVCQNSISPRWGMNSRNGACYFNALTVIWGGLGVTFFWCAVAINSFIAIYLKRDSILRSRWFEIGTHVICWGVPSVCALIALATKQIGTPQQLLFCFVTDDPYHPPANLRTAFSWQYPLFFGPIGFCIVIATGAIVMVLYEMRNLRAASGSGRFNKHIRIALFLVVFLAIFAFVFAYRFTITTGGNSWRAALTEWASAAQLGVAPTGLKNEPSYGLFMAFLFMIGCQGLLVSLLFGSNTDVLSFWGERIQNIREGRSFFSGITSYTASSKVGASSVRATGNAD